MKFDEHLKKNLAGQDKEKLKAVKKLISPALIQKVYACLCNPCKMKALKREENFCSDCKAKFEQILTEANA